MKTIEIKIEGMTCIGCELSTEMLLSNMKGISKSEVSTDPGKAVIEFDESKTSPEKIVKAINELGYKAQKI